MFEYDDYYDDPMDDIREPFDSLSSFDQFDDWSSKYIREDWRLRDSIRDYIEACQY